MDDSLRELYQEVILDHSRHPRHFGPMEHPTHSGEGYNPLCGDRVKIYLSVDANDRIADIKFEGKGCAISQASASVLNELLVGKDLTDARKIQETFLELMQSKGKIEPDDAMEEVLEDAVAFAGVSKYPARVKCALLSWMAWKDATAQALGGADAERKTA